MQKTLLITSVFTFGENYYSTTVACFIDVPSIEKRKKSFRTLKADFTILFTLLNSGGGLVNFSERKRLSSFSVITLQFN